MDFIGKIIWIGGIEMDYFIDLIVGLGINAIMILALLSLNGKFTPIKKRLSFISLALTLIFALIPSLGYRVDNEFGDVYFGFPADVIVYHGGWLFSSGSLGLVFNFVFFYWVCKCIYKLWGVLTVKNPS
jgi:hypothetical protein